MTRVLAMSLKPPDEKPPQHGSNTNTNTSGYCSQMELMVPPGGQQQDLDTSHSSFHSFSDFNPNMPKFDGGVTTRPRLSRERGLSHSKRHRRRLVYKNGEVNVQQTNIKKRKQRYLADIFTTLVDLQWRWILLLFILAFTLSWLVFALVWWLICFSHGDLEKYETKDWKPCVVEVHDFVTALLFSIETQHTIGYGYRHTTHHCPEAIFVMMLQSCFGVIIQALMTGIVFAKLSRPKYRAETLLFSKNAVICRRDGVLCLLCRVGDMRKSHLVEAHVRAVVIRHRVTREGERIVLAEQEVQLGPEEGCDARLFLLWPTILEHRITDHSPFWDLAPEDLHKDSFELLVILEGIVESTGMTTQARTSYLPGEILWGHRFERLEKKKESGEYEVNYSRFHSTVACDTPQCSARELAEMDLSDASTTTEQYGEDDDEEDLDDDELSLSTQSSVKLEPHDLPQANHILGIIPHDFPAEEEFLDQDTYNFMTNQL